MRSSSSPFHSFHVSTVLATLLLGAATTAQALEVSHHESFPVTPGGVLLVDVDRGSVEIVTGDGAVVDVVVTREIKSLSDAKAKEILDQHQLALANDANKVSVKANFPKSLGWNNRANAMVAKYVVTVPKQFNVEVRTAGGAIRLGDLTGKADLHTAGGSIAVGEIDGVIKAETSGGSIKVTNVTGNADLRTAGGNLQLGKIGGDVNAETAGGSIQLESAANAVRAHTAGGGLQLNGLGGPVDAETSGGSITARYVRALKGDNSLRTSGGSITVFLPKDVNASVDAQTSAGRVESELPVSGAPAKPKDSLRGDLGSGGPKLKLRTSAGSISLRAVDLSKS